MVKSIKWSPESFEDLKEIADYIRKDSIVYASAVIEKILNSVKHLIQYPESGRIVPEVNKADIREIFQYNYRIVYRIYQEYILVIAVIHGKRLLENVKDRF